MLMKKWLFREFDKERVVEISKKFKISPLSAIVLYNRNIREDDEIEKFLNCDLTMVHDPFLMKDMDLAVSRITRAKEKGERITIYGDYDADGITSIVILHKFLTEMGIDTDYYIPDRIAEGYGINCGAIDTIKERGSSLIITVDTGITGIEECEYAKSIGIDVIITDHHECKDKIPNVVAALDPKRKECRYPFKYLAGVGVVFKLIQALSPNVLVEQTLDKYLDFICLGTVADISPLIGENRFIVVEGLKRMAVTKNVGLQVLMEVSVPDISSPITASTIGYSIAPRINASGRLGCASRSVELFLTDDKEKAYKLANYLCDENTLRQQTEQRMFKEALEYLEEHPEVKNDDIIVIPHENWHLGIVGIVSSKITEKFYKPSILFAVGEEDAKGSGRSVSGVNMFEALENCSDILDKFGGHELAAGICIKRKNIEPLRKKINQYVKKIKRGEELMPTIYLDAAIKMPYITMETVEEIMKLQPFGVDNTIPLFAVRGVQITRLRLLHDNKHLRITVTKDGKYIDAIGFGMGEYAKNGYIHVGCTIDVAFSLDINEYKGNRNLQLVLKDIKKIKDSDSFIVRKKKEEEAENADLQESEI